MPFGSEQRGVHSVDEHGVGPGPATVFLISFPNVHQALKCENVLLRTGRRVQVIPVPRRVSSSCGLAVEVTADDIADGRSLVRHLEDGGVDYDGVYLLRPHGRYELICEGIGSPE